MFLVDPVISWEHAVTFFSGMTFLGLVGHAVNSFPTPSGPYGQWLLGVIKFAVGQRISAMNAFKGTDTVAISVPQGTGKDVQRQASIGTSDGNIVIDEKTKTTIPKGTGTGTGE